MSSGATPALPRWSRRPGNSWIEGLVALARQHRAWIGSVEAWEPAARSQRAQFAALARHLLARYEVPAFMDSVWFKEPGAAAWYLGLEIAAEAHEVLANGLMLLVAGHVVMAILRAIRR